ncbi:MAG: NAD(P)-dependent oxidoreductase [Myxococcota bacterium]
MRVAVTGASGVLGRRLVAALQAGGHDVLALVRDPARATASAVAWQLGAPAPLDGIEALIHAAAHRPARFGDPAEASACLAANAAGTATLAADAAAAGVAHLVYVSAGNVYRDPGRPATEDDPIEVGERAPYYLGSKVCGEWFAAAAGPARVTAVRPAALYGPGMPPGLVSTFVARLGAGEAVTVADGGRYQADLVHVDDVAEATVAVLTRGRAPAYNLGSGAPTTALALAREIAALVGAGPDRIEVAPPAGDPPGFVALDIARARADLGFAPRPLRDGLRTLLGAP